MNGARETIENGVVIVTENRITAVGEMGSVSIPEGAKVVDLVGKTLLPGYIDAHAHGPYAATISFRRITGRSLHT